MRLKRMLASFVLAAVAVASLSACAAQSNNAPPVDPTANASQCFTELSPQQSQELSGYLQSQGSQVSTSLRDDWSDTEDVCVLRASNSTTYEQHYYRPNDGGLSASDILLYHYMFRRSSSLGTALLISQADDLDAGDLLALSLLMNIGDDGRTYRPYSYDSGARSWSRSNTVVNNTTVTNVYYGSSRTPVRFTDTRAKSYKAPSGYAPTKPLPKATDEVAATKDTAGKVSLKKVPVGSTTNNGSTKASANQAGADKKGAPAGSASGSSSSSAGTGKGSNSGSSNAGSGGSSGGSRSGTSSGSSSGNGSKPAPKRPGR